MSKNIDNLLRENERLARRRIANAARLRERAEALRREADEALQASTRELLEASTLLEELHGRARPH